MCATLYLISVCDYPCLMHNSDSQWRGAVSHAGFHVADPRAETFLRQHVRGQRRYVRVCMLAPWRN